MTTQHEWPLWEVFVRTKAGLDHKHCGSLQDSPRGRSRKSLFVYGQGLAWRLGITITRSGHPIQAFQATTDRSPAVSEVAAGLCVR